MSRVPAAVLRNKGVPVEVALVDDGKVLLADDESPRTTTVHVRFNANALADLEEAFGSLDHFDAMTAKQPTVCIRRALAISWGVEPFIAGLMMLDGRQDDYATAIAVAMALANGVDPLQASELLETGVSVVSEARRTRNEAIKKMVEADRIEKQQNAEQVAAAMTTAESPGTNGGGNGSATVTPLTPTSSGV